MIDQAVPLIGIIGVLTGAAVQAVLSSYFEPKRSVRTERVAAYKALMKAVSVNFREQQFNWDDVVIDASFREACLGVALYGSQNVLRTMAGVIERDGIPEQFFDAHRLYELILAMRRDVIGHQDHGSKIDLYSVMNAGGNQ